MTEQSTGWIIERRKMDYDNGLIEIDISVARMIARAAEAAYRRGFQQGYRAATLWPGLEEKISDWRFCDNLHRSPPGPGFGGADTTSVKRLLMEMPGWRELR